MEDTFIHNARIVFPGTRITTTGIRFSSGKVVSIGNDIGHPNDAVIDAKGRLLTPGLIDMHVHGVLHHGFDTGPEALLAAASCFPRFGVTTVFPTLVPRHTPDMLDRLAAMAAGLKDVAGSTMPGLHLEGPFTALTGAGCEAIPGDIHLLEEILSACQNRVRIMSLSPETPNILPVIEHLVEHGIAPFVTHTQASLEQTQTAIAAGARHATHFYDVFPIPEVEDPGVRPVGAVEAFLANPAATVDFIADGCHVDPIVIQLALQAKTFTGVAVVSDGNIGAGLPPGVYDTPWGYPVEVQPGNGARIADPNHPSFGALAGSALTMDLAMINLLKWIDSPPENIWAMATSTPAHICGLTNKGSLQPGKDADAVLWNQNMTPAMTWIGGGVKYQNCPHPPQNLPLR